jgi:hypothetical protein
MKLKLKTLSRCTLAEQRPRSESFGHAQRSTGRNSHSLPLPRFKSLFALSLMPTTVAADRCEGVVQRHGHTTRVRCRDMAKPTRTDGELFDRLTLAQLARAGGDLTKPTGVANFAYFPSEEAARSAATELEAAGYRVNVQRAVMGPKWLTQASIEMLPSAENVASQRARLEALAAAHGGKYDGWEPTAAK